MQTLIRTGQIELYQIGKAIVGVNDFLDYCQDFERITFVQNFSFIQLQPFCHRNTIEFLGMENKLNYLIWREKNGFFSALDVDGEMHTWSMASGKHLYELKDKKWKRLIEGF